MWLSYVWFTYIFNISIKTRAMHEIISKKIYSNIILRAIYYHYKIYKRKLYWCLINLYIYYKNTNKYRKTYKFYLRYIFHHEYFTKKKSIG